MKYTTQKRYRNRVTFKKVAMFIIAILFHLINANSSIANPQPKDEIKGDIKDAMVKIYTVSSEPNYFSPWKMDDPVNATGSGCIIADNRIITNAHVVSNQKFIQVQLYGQSERHNAHILHISHEADLAILTVEDKTFFENIAPLEFGILPNTLEEVLVYGFPSGGDSLSITKGILSRVEYQEYTHSNYYLLAGQIDAAINPGNSGGPVIVDDKIIGIAMQKIRSDEIDNIGYLIPTVIVKHFLEDIEDGHYDGFPETGFIVQNMENPSMKAKFGMTKEQTGVLVNHVHWNSTAEGKIKKDDVILSIDGHEIADNGTIAFRPKERILYAYYSDMHQVGDTLNLTVLRNGKIKNITYPLNLTGADIRLVTSKQYDVKPRYFIFAGIVFSPLSQNLFCAWEECDAPDELQVLKNKFTTKNRKEVVLALQVLPDDINKGYHDTQAMIIKEVNGKEFKDFNDFYRLVIASNDPFVEFKSDTEKRIIVDRQEAEETHERILETYNIKDDSSPDMKSLYAELHLISSKNTIRLNFQQD